MNDSHATGPGEPAPGLVLDMLSAYQRTAALRAAIELDIFRAIGAGAGEVAELAERCKASTRGIRILCDYLTVAGVLRKQGDRYAHTPTSAAFLDPASPVCLASTARFTGHPMLEVPFRQLAAIVREGHTVLPGQGSVEPDNPAWVEFAKSMAPLLAFSAGPLARLALDGLAGPLRVLDIAAGHGLFGIEIARRRPDAAILALDWAAVLEIAVANAARAGVADRYRTRPGNAFEVDLAGPHDLVLLTNFLHHFDAETCTAFLRKVRTALAPGGRLAILEFVPNADRVSPPNAAGFALVMLATTVAGEAYTGAELTAMLERAGFGGIGITPIPPSPHTVVIATASPEETSCSS